MMECIDTYHNHKRDIFVSLLEDKGDGYRSTGIRYAVAVSEDDGSTEVSWRGYANYDAAFVNFIAEITVIQSCLERRCISI
jgi:hypothetical protein